MDQRDNREARASGGVSDRAPATVSVPAKDSLGGEAQAPNRVSASGKLNVSRRHLENVCSPSYIEHVGPIEKARKRLAILAVAHEAEAAGRRNLTRHAAHVATSATKREIQPQACHLGASDHNPHLRVFLALARGQLPQIVPFDHLSLGSVRTKGSVVGAELPQPLGPRAKIVFREILDAEPFGRRFAQRRRHQRVARRHGR
jgi:hypothetical protein